MKFPYDDSYVPPAPSIEIRLGLPTESLRLGPLSALLDTGADICIIPIAHLEQLGAELDDHRLIHSPWGERVPVDLYMVDIGIGQERYPSIQVAGDEQGTEIIAGRNLLNKLNLNLNGPGKVLEII